MRWFGLVIAVGGLIVFFGACATMEKYEMQRQIRLGLRPSPTPTPTTIPSSTPSDGQVALAEVEDIVVTPGPKPLDSSSGTLFQPWTKPVVRDILGERMIKSADVAEAQVEATRPQISIDKAPGPIIPVLKTLLKTKDDLTVVSRVFLAYAEAVHAVRVSVDAFGLKPNVVGMRHVREAYVFWQKYFTAMQIFPEGREPSPVDIQAFYDELRSNGKNATDDITAINALINQQRSRPFVSPTPQPTKAP